MEVVSGMSMTMVVKTESSFELSLRRDLNCESAVFAPVLASFIFYRRSRDFCITLGWFIIFASFSDFYGYGIEMFLYLF